MDGALERPGQLTDASSKQLASSVAFKAMSPCERNVMDDPRLMADSLEHDVLSDEELTSLALAADPDAPLELDAVPWNFGFGSNLLPEWYMPRPMARGRGRGTRIVVGSLVVGFLVIGAFGLCITSGFIQFA
jgi:hypothetical protein